MTIKEARRELLMIVQRIVRKEREIKEVNTASGDVFFYKNIQEILSEREELIGQHLALALSIQIALTPLLDILQRIDVAESTIEFLNSLKGNLFCKTSIEPQLSVIKAQLSVEEIEEMIRQEDEKIISMKAQIDVFEAENEVEGLVSQE